MPLKLLTGETLTGMKSKPIVVPLAKWQDTELFEMAARQAEAALGRAEKLRKGWKGRIRGEVPRYIFGPNEILVQVYPYEPSGPAIAFIFCKMIQGKERFAPFVLTLSDEVVRSLRLANRWPTAVDVQRPMVAA